MQTKASYQDTVTEREAKNKALAFEAATEGIVLLENDGALPIKPGKMALFGAGAAYTIQGGSGSGEVNARHTVSALEGLENSGFTVTTKDWIHRYDTEWKAGKEAFLRENRKNSINSTQKPWQICWRLSTAIPAAGKSARKNSV